MALALGHNSVVLVQPGSAPSSQEQTGAVACAAVEPAASCVAPGGAYYDNSSMLAYLLAREPLLRAGYYLTQPKDEHGGFSAATLEATTRALVDVGRAHGCTALVALDFGGDVALPEPPSAAAGSVHQRDLLNLRAATAAATELGIAGEHRCLVAAALGVDAAAIAPAYTERRLAPPPADEVMEMTREGKLVPLDGPPPAPELPTLPAAAFCEARRAPCAPYAARFAEENSRLARQVEEDATAEHRAQHSAKTYALVAAVHAETRRRAETGSGAGGGFFVVGMYRGAEKARPHMHSSYALEVYDLSPL
jgi:hypothetical protein